MRLDHQEYAKLKANEGYNQKQQAPSTQDEEESYTKSTQRSECGRFTQVYSYPVEVTLLASVPS